MKRLLVLLAAALMLPLFSVPAAHAAADNCNTYTNPAGGKKVQVCVSVELGSGPVRWARVEYHDVNGYGLPYAVNTNKIIYWSRPDSGGTYCEGKATGCTGVGNGSLLVTNLTHAGSPYAAGSDHYTVSQFYCDAHGEASNGAIWWTLSDWNAGPPSARFDFNTSYDVDAGTGPTDCIA